MPFATDKLTRTLMMPLLLLVLITLAARTWDVDIFLADYFCHEGAWPWAEKGWVRFLAAYGCWPGLVCGLLGLFLAAYGLLARSVIWHRGGWLLALCLAIGPGLLINVVLKSVTYRPRPVDLVEFGGEFAYTEVGVVGYSPHARSFPSGHASMGFMLMAPMFVFVRRQPRWALFFFALGMLGGASIGAARIVAGKHFFTDVIWSAGTVYLTGLGLYYLLALHRLPLATRPVLDTWQVPPRSVTPPIVPETASCT